MIAPSVLLAETARAWVGRLGARSVLDVGCGSGDFVRALRRDGIRAFGVDPRPVLVQGDAAALPFPSGAFDLTTSLLVVHYLSDPVRALAEAARVLKQGGRIIVADRFASSNPDHERVERLRNPSVHGFPAFPEFEKLLAGAGFDIDHVQGLEAQIPMEEWLGGVPGERGRALRAQGPRDLGTIVLEGPTVRFRMKFCVARKAP